MYIVYVYSNVDSVLYNFILYYTNLKKILFIFLNIRFIFK